jgi:ABC-2 type transport system ATP-binding protein
VIEVEALSKRYRGRVAVDEVTFSVSPGRVTGFLGPNGAGKSTTMRLILELARPSGGTALIAGKPLHEHPDPMRRVGALLSADAMHPGRTAWSHLCGHARTHRISRHRVEEVVDLVGLDRVAHVRVGRFSLGMRQRLALATALLGDPEVLMLDEPTTGLDADGIRWLRHLLRELADQGRTVFVSSHLMSELAMAVDHVVVIGQGRVLADAPLHDVLAAGSDGVRVMASDPAGLRRTLEAGKATVVPLPDGALSVRGISAVEVGRLALVAGVALSELGVVQSLEAAYFALTDDSVEYRAGVPA